MSCTACLTISASMVRRWALENHAILCYTPPANSKQLYIATNTLAHTQFIVRLASSMHSRTVVVVPPTPPTDQMRNPSNHIVFSRSRTIAMIAAPSDPARPDQTRPGTHLTCTVAACCAVNERTITVPACEPACLLTFLQHMQTPHRVLKQ
jgi:hypothetical protein